MQKVRYRYRIYPNKQQQIALAKLFGCCRVVWNNALAFCKSQLKKTSGKELSKRLTESKKNEETSWLKEVSSVPLQQSLRDLEQAYSNFFNSCKGKRKGKKVKPPKFKKRKSKQSARFTNNAFKLVNNKVYLPKIGNLKVIWSRDLPFDHPQGKPFEPTSVTVIKESSGEYYLSFVVEINPQSLPENNNSIGIDLGIIDFATFSNGEKVKAPKPLKQHLKKLRKLQKDFSRTEKGSNRREVARIKVAKLHSQVKNTREDFLHKLSTKIIRENQTIVLEDLKVSGMVKNRKLARAISDLGWRIFRDMLEAKAEMYGRDFCVIDRWTPTSQTCSCCGFKGGKKELSIREWTCLNCGAIHDRDINAAQNILAVGQTDSLNGHGESVKPSTRVTFNEVPTHQLFEQLTLFK